MVVHAYYPFGETRVEREALALVDCGYEVDVICLQGREQPANEIVDGIGIHRVPVRRHKSHGAAIQLLEYLAFFFWAFIKLTGLHRRRRYNVVQVHNLPDFLIFAAVVPKLTGARLILDLHDLMPEFYAARFGSSLDSWPMRLIRWQETLACRFSDHVMTVTEGWRETLIERGVPVEKVTVIMNIADDRFFQQPTLDEPHAQDGYFGLIYHGNLSWRYGIDLAIRAIHQLKKTVPTHLIIHGSGPRLKELKKLVSDLDLAERVHFSTRAVPTAELPAMIRKANAGIVPYRRDVFTDGILPTKLMEYIALGIPVIAARTPTMDAYLDDTMVEFFAPGDVDDLAQHILTLYTDHGRREQLVRGSQEFTQRYNWPKISAEYVALVDRLAS